VLGQWEVGPRRASDAGLYQKLSEAHTAVRRWCAEHGYALAGPNWEIYGDWTDNPAELRTDVFYLLQESEQHKQKGQ